MGQQGIKRGGLPSWAILLIILGGLVAAAGACGVVLLVVAPRRPGPAPTATPLPVIGEWVAYHGQAILVEEIAYPRQINSGIGPTVGWRFVCLKVRYQNRGDGSVRITSSEFEVVTKNGAVYTPQDFFRRLEPALANVELLAGGEAGGWITYEIPAGEELREVRWKPSWPFGPEIYIGVVR